LRVASALRMDELTMESASPRSLQVSWSVRQRSRRAVARESHHADHRFRGRGRDLGQDRSAARTPSHILSPTRHWRPNRGELHRDPAQSRHRKTRAAASARCKYLHVVMQLLVVSASRAVVSITRPFSTRDHSHTHARANSLSHSLTHTLTHTCTHMFLWARTHTRTHTRIHLLTATNVHAHAHAF